MLDRKDELVAELESYLDLHPQATARALKAHAYYHLGVTDPAFYEGFPLTEEERGHTAGVFDGLMRLMTEGWSGSSYQPLVDDAVETVRGPRSLSY
jgi:hypothetical protein